jgi:hypothetical protein
MKTLGNKFFLNCFTRSFQFRLHSLLKRLLLPNLKNLSARHSIEPLAKVYFYPLMMRHDFAAIVYQQKGEKSFESRVYAAVVHNRRLAAL